MAFFEEMTGRGDELRGRAAGLLGAGQDEVALTGSTTDGVNAALNALDLSRATSCSPPTRSTRACWRRSPPRAPAA